MQLVFLAGRNEVVAKDMFLLVSVILSVGGSASVHAGILPPPAKETPRKETAWNEAPPAKETPLPRRPPCQGDPTEGDPLEVDPPPEGGTPPPSRPTPKGEIEGDQVQAHTQGGN